MLLMTYSRLVTLNFQRFEHLDLTKPAECCSCLKYLHECEFAFRKRSPTLSAFSLAQSKLLPNSKKRFSP